MDRTHIFGWRESGSNDHGGAYIRDLKVRDLLFGDAELEIRDQAGVSLAIYLPCHALDELGRKLLGRDALNDAAETAAIETPSAGKPADREEEMDRTQIFGWTDPETPRQGYAKTLMAFSRPDGVVEVEARDPLGHVVSVTLLGADLVELGHAALSADTMGTIERAREVGAVLAETVKATGGKQMFHLTQVGDITRVEVFPVNPFEVTGLVPSDD